ncbi:MAG: TolC family protein [Acidobacteria bacterium]|nr:TolC family protein [Acidobacteriota bacterium]
MTNSKLQNSRGTMSYEKKSAIAFLLLSLTVSGLYAQQPLTLQQALEQAKNNNRLYQSHLQRVELLKGKFDQAGRRPNPQLESAVASTPSGEDHALSLLVVQKWERGGKRELRRQIAGGEVEQAQLQADDFARVLSAQIRLVFLEQLRLQKETSVLEAHMNRINRMIKLDEVRVREGEVPALNLAHLQVELMRTSIRKEDLENQRKLAQFRLNALIGGVPETENSLVDEEGEKGVLPSAEQATSYALKNRPDLKRLRIALQQSQHEIDMEEAVKKLDWNVGLGYQREHTTFGREDVIPRDLFRSLTDTDHVLQLKLQVPIPLWDNNAGNVAAAISQKKAREAELAYAESVVRAEILATLQRYRQNQGLSETLYKTLLPGLEADLQREEAAYELTGVGLGDWIRDQRNYSEGALQGVETDFELRKAVVELEGEVGGSLQQVAQTP